MCRMPWTLYLWPGLPQLWIRGTWHALAVAVLAAVALNFALLGTFGFSELMAPQVRSFLWVGLGMAWALAATFSLVMNRRRGVWQGGTERDATTENDFGEATEHYLKGNWFEAERLFTAILHENPRDPEARLTLATLLRRTGRLDEVRSHLDTLGRLEDARKWQCEIQTEYELLAEAEDGSLAEKTIPNEEEDRDEEVEASELGDPAAEHDAA